MWTPVRRGYRLWASSVGYTLNRILLWVQRIWTLGTLLRLVLDLLGWAVARACRFGAERSQLRVAVEATSYEEWVDVTRSLETEENILWRAQPESDLYDFAWLRSEKQQLRRCRLANNVEALAFCFQRGIFNRRHCELDNPKLYAHSPLGTKHAIEQYLEEVEASLDFLCETSFFTWRQKKSLFKQAQRSLGCTALCLSGGGALALCHAGVVQELLERGILPSVISGTSGGSIIAGYMACYTDAELLALISPYLAGAHGRLLSPIPTALWHFIRHGVAMKSKDFCNVIRRHFGKHTFATAYAHSKRSVSITATKIQNGNSTPVLLNYRTTPHILIWSAVAASCALPGLMNPITLMMLPPETDGLSDDEIARGVPAFPSGVVFRDGSIWSDLPLSSLRRHFHVNQFVVGQANIHVRPFVGGASTEAPSWAQQAEEYFSSNMKHRATRLAKAGLFPPLFGQDPSGVFLQSYSQNTRDQITCVPPIRPTDYLGILSMPTPDAMRRYLHLGRAAVWPRVAQIRDRVRIEQRIASCLERARAHNSSTKRRLRRFDSAPQIGLTQSQLHELNFDLIGNENENKHDSDDSELGVPAAGLQRKIVDGRRRASALRRLHRSTDTLHTHRLTPSAAAMASDDSFADEEEEEAAAAAADGDEELRADDDVFELDALSAEADAAASSLASPEDDERDAGEARSARSLCESCSGLKRSGVRRAQFFASSR